MYSLGQTHVQHFQRRNDVMGSAEKTGHLNPILLEGGQGHKMYQFITKNISNVMMIILNSPKSLPKQLVPRGGS